MEHTDNPNLDMVQLMKQGRKQLFTAANADLPDREMRYK